MSPRRLVIESLERSTPEETLVEFFRRADYDVEVRVGSEPGTVVRVATPRTGFVRPRTYFMAVNALPNDIDATLDELEKARERSGADRAVAVLMNGALPQGYEPDLPNRTSNVLTLKRWFLEVSEMADDLREWAGQTSNDSESDDTPYLPRRARLDTGQEVDVDRYIQDWLTSTGERRSLFIAGPSRSGKATTLRAAVKTSAIQFVKNPEHHTPLYFWNESDIAATAEALGFVVACVPSRQVSLVPNGASLCKLGPTSEPTTSGSSNNARTIELLPPNHEEIELWFRSNLESSEMAQLVGRACRANKNFAALVVHVPNLRLVLDAIRYQVRDARTPSTDHWIASVIVAYTQRMNPRPYSPDLRYEDEQSNMENAALEQFALGISSRRLVMSIRIRGSQLGWLDRDSGSFTNELIRDYFLARKVIREVQLGNESVLLRYQFPPFVFLFISLIAPEISAGISGGTLARMEDKIRDEAERIAQLGFAHRLNRPVGSMRQYLAEIKDALDREKKSQLERAFTRVEEEIDYIENLADKTRRWQAGPSGAPEFIDLRSRVEDELGPLAKRYPRVTLQLDISHDLRVLAVSDALHEVLHCIFENAFHAVLCTSDSTPARIIVQACRVGDVVRIEVEDNGLGVNPADRDLIFEPFKTNKTGGAGKPRGTGLGLAIAKRFVESMGGRIGLDVSRSATCFFIELVAGKQES